MNWHQIRNISKKKRKEYEAFRGEKEEGKEIEEEAKGVYDELLRLSEAVVDEAGPNRVEAVYQEWLAYRLEDIGIEVKLVKEYEVEENEAFCKKRMDIYLEEEEIILELKTKHLKKSITQLKNYMKQMNKSLGFLIEFVKGSVNVLMIKKYENGVYYIYDGVNMYNHGSE